MPFKKNDPLINRNGRPQKDQCLTSLLKKRLDKDEFVAQVIELAKKGDAVLIKYIWERIEGKLPEILDADVDINIIFKNLSKKKK